MNLSYLVFVTVTLVVAAVVSALVVLVARKKSAKAKASAASSKIKALKYNPVSSREVDLLVSQAIRLWSIETNLARFRSRLSESEAASMEAEALSLREQLDANDMYYYDPTGQHYSPASYYEVVSVQDGVDLKAFGTSLVVAKSPAVVYKNELIRKAKVDIASK